MMAYRFRCALRQCNLLVVLGVLVCFACAPSTGSATRMAEAELLDSVFLAPPLQPDGPFLLCFRFEVTLAEFSEKSVPADLADFPATMMTRPEAQTWAKAQGMRLPTRAEWFHLMNAGGTAILVKDDRANTLGLGLQRALKVGVFERGKTALGGYDFVGNVWEWLADDLEGVDPTLAPERALQIGGSFASYLPDRPDQDFGWFREAHELNRASDVGFRPVADALPWLRRFILPVWPHSSPQDQQALESAMKRWRPFLRRELASQWIQAYPGQADFGKFLAGP
jgi:sulfatase-modifying factor enzyme 1